MIVTALCASDDLGHCRRVDDAQPVDSANPHLRIEHRVASASHGAGTGRMVGDGGKGPHVCVDLGIGLYTRPGKSLTDHQICRWRRLEERAHLPECGAHQPAIRLFSE
jgi:hypothetical protein